MEISEFIKQISLSVPGNIKMDSSVGIYTKADGCTEVITALSQFRINEKGSEPKVYSPSLYQSCMEPDNQKLYNLKVMIDLCGTVHFITRYGEGQFSLGDENVQCNVSKWIPAIHTSDCTHCTNCGKCSW